MNAPAIHVHTVSDRSTVKYVQFMWDTMRNLATHPDDLRLTVHCLGNIVNAFGELKNGRCVIVNINKDNETGSNAHAAGVADAIRQTNDGAIHIIADSDTVVVVKGWDDYVRCKLIDEKIGIVGVTYEDVGGFSSGDKRTQTYKGIPNVVWCALSPRHSWSGLSVMPAKHKTFQISNDRMSKIYNLPIGYDLLRDVAWQIPQYLADNNITYVGWKHLKGSRGGKVLAKDISDYSEEFHVDDGIPFVVHQRGSLRNGYRDNGVSKNFYDRVDAHLNVESAAPPRWTWNGMYEVVTPSPAIVSVDPIIPDDPTASSGDGGNCPAGEWIKATFDGTIVWPKQRTPAPKTLDVKFLPDHGIKSLRLEGTTKDLFVAVPPLNGYAHAMTIRNMTAGVVTVKTSEGDRTVAVPKDACWMLLVDIDGVVHVT